MFRRPSSYLKVLLEEINELMKSNDPEEIKAGMDRLGHSVEKVFLADRLQQLTHKEEEGA
jgi:hypothetical protein